MFFDDHGEFLETSSTANSRKRLNWRHRAMIEANEDVLAGARVLDIASHDGRWSFAALQAGAAHVIGVEGRPELVENANSTFADGLVDPDTYRFICGDVFDVLADPGAHGIEVDVVMCLGFLYHTLRYPEMFAGIRRLNPRHVIIDTQVYPSEDRVIFLALDRVEVQGQAIDGPLAYNDLMLAGHPSPQALTVMLDVYDFDVTRRYDWEELASRRPALARPAILGGYANGTRITWVAENRNTDGTTPSAPKVMLQRRRKNARRIEARAEKKAARVAARLERQAAQRGPEGVDDPRG